MSNQYNTQQVFVNTQPRPSRFAHGFLYWILLGWWWCTLKFLGRVTLWIFLFPLGVWRSVVNHQNKRDARIRRGYR